MLDEGNANVPAPLVGQAKLAGGPSLPGLYRVKGRRMSLLGLIIVIIVLLAVLPRWPYSAGWGYYPSGGLGLVVIVLVVLLLAGRI